jgi:hypothetical protein
MVVEASRTIRTTLEPASLAVLTRRSVIAFETAWKSLLARIDETAAAPAAR